MGRTRQRKTKAADYLARTTSKKRPRVSTFGKSIEEFDDEIDKFHKGDEKISLVMEEDLELSDDDVEQPVLDLKTEDSSNDDDEDEESDDDELDEEELSGLVAKMAKQSKMLRQETYLMDNNYEDESEDEHQARNNKAAWGQRKRMYYDADTVDYELLSSDEEAPAEEEAEALRLQCQITERLQPEDFEFDSDDYENSPKDDESSLQEVAEKAKEEKGDDRLRKLLSRRGHLDALIKDGSVYIEEVKKDVNALSKEEQMDAVMSDAPELVDLLAELRKSSHELYSQIQPLLLKVKACSNVNKVGRRYLKAKQVLIPAYNQSILFYLLLKAEGRTVHDHPVIARLVEIRAVLQKLQLIDEKLQSQIDGVLTPLKDISPLTELKVQENPKQYVQLPSMPSKHEKSHASDAMDREKTKDKQFEEKAVHRPMSTNLVDAENSHAPDASDREGTKDKQFEKTAVPRTMSTKLVDTDLRTLPNISLQPKFLSMSSDDDDAVHDSISLHRLIRTKAQKRKPGISGDMDLPLREDLGARRSKIERQKRPYLKNVDIPDEAGDIEKEAFEDEFYRQAKQLKDLRRAAKGENPVRMRMLDPPIEEDVGKRHITYQMEKNKGLTPYRKRLTKNPRKKYKLKHQKAIVRRKGQVQEVKLPSGPYGGEATGIRTAISRSVRFHN